MLSSRGWTIFATVLGSGMVFLDSTIVPVALPRMGQELTSTWFETLEAQSYVYYGYLLSLSALLILAGALTDYFGRRRMFAWGLASFAAASLLCGVAPTMEWLIAGRVLQGATGALLVPGSLAILAASFGGEEQGRAFGLWAAASSATTILGPVVGGALVTYVSWRAAFLINLPFAAVALWATVAHVAETRDEESTGSFDWLGALVVALAVGGLTYGAIRGEAQRWQDTGAFASLAIGGVAAIGFPFVMARRPHPLVPLSLFQSRNFSVTNLSTLLIYGAIYVAFQFLALFAIGILGYNEVAYGLAIIPSDLFLALLSTRMGTLADQYGPRLFMALGPALMGLALLWFVRIPPDSAPWRFAFGDPSSWLPPTDFLVDILPTMTLFGLGLALMVTPLTTALMRSVPVSRSGVASAFNNAVSRVGPQLGGALLFVLVSTSFYASLDGSLDAGHTPTQVREQLTPMNPPPQGAPASVAQAARDASTNSFRLAMGGAALMCLLGAIINAVGIRNQDCDTERAAKPISPCPQSPPVEAAAP